MKLTISLFVVPILILSSCEKPKEGRPTENKVADVELTLVSAGTIEIPLDSMSLNYSTYPVYYENDTAEYYIVGNEIINSIDFYDLNKKKLVKRNMYDKAGAKGILFTSRIGIHSLDSIYVYSPDDKRILLTNFNGDVLQTWGISQYGYANLAMPLRVNKNDVYLGLAVRGDSRFQFGHQALLKYDLVSHNYEEYGTAYPKEFNETLYFYSLPYFTYGHDQNIITRFQPLPYIFIFNKQTSDTAVYLMKSIFQKSPIVPGTEAEVRYMDHDFEQLVQPEYGGIYYDKYTRYYYSVFNDGIPVVNEAGDKNSYYDKPVSLIIFNEEYEFCGEFQLKPNTYYGNYIPTKKGLLIPTSHQNNPDNNEDVLQFERFVLQKKE